jgi:hypothetical protein
MQEYMSWAPQSKMHQLLERLLSAECLRQRISHMQLCLTNPIGVSKGCSEGKVSNTNGITSSMPQPAEITGQFQNSLLDQVRPCSRVVVRSLRRVPC